MQIGLLGGTFDPIHLGHLIVAEAVREQLGLAQVVFIPAGSPWLKADRQIASSAHRLAMVLLATESNRHFRVSTAELDRPGPSYTVDTIEAMRQESDAADELLFIAGPDALADLPRWKEPERILRLCRIVAVGRPGVPGIDLAAIQSVIPQVASRVDRVEVPQIGISSSLVRERARAGLSIRYLVPIEVERYIHRHRLYGP